MGALVLWIIGYEHKVRIPCLDRNQKEWEQLCIAHQRQTRLTSGSLDIAISSSVRTRTNLCR